MEIKTVILLLVNVIGTLTCGASVLSEKDALKLLPKSLWTELNSAAAISSFRSYKIKWTDESLPTDIRNRVLSFLFSVIQSDNVSLKYNLYLNIITFHQARLEDLPPDGYQDGYGRYIEDAIVGIKRQICAINVDNIADLGKYLIDNTEITARKNGKSCAPMYKHIEGYRFIINIQSDVEVYASYRNSDNKRVWVHTNADAIGILISTDYNDICSIFPVIYKNKLPLDGIRMVSKS